MQFATSTYDTADNSVTPCTPGLTPGKFCIGIEKRKQYFAKLWVVTKVYYGQYKSGHLTIQSSTLNLQTDPRLRVTKYSLS